MTSKLKANFDQYRFKYLDITIDQLKAEDILT